MRQLSMAIAACWPVPPQATATGHVARLRLSLRPDGSLAGEPALLDEKDDPAFQALAASALRAVRRCAPFTALARSGEPYARWREIVLNFRSPP